jgi:hypothetical protein
VIAAVAAGVLAAFVATQDDEKPREKSGPVTVTTQETLGGTTVVTTVVTTMEPEPPPTVSIDEAVQLTDEATELLRDKLWDEALQTQRRALPPLQGTYTDDFRYEAYAAYNMGKALAELGRCDKAIPFLDRSEELQGHRGEIDKARKLCEEKG